MLFSKKNNDNKIKKQNSFHNNYIKKTYHEITSS